MRFRKSYLAVGLAALSLCIGSGVAISTCMLAQQAPDTQISVLPQKALAQPTLSLHSKTFTAQKSDNDQKTDYKPKVTYASSAAIPAGPRYAVIEVGSSGIKTVVVELKRTPTVPKAVSVVKGDIKPRNEFAVEKATIGKVAEAVQELIQKVGTDYGVPRDHVYVVGSSGLAGQAHWPEIQDTVKSAIGATTVPAVSPAEEASLTFAGIILPHRVDQVVSIDIGSGNTKIAYAEEVVMAPKKKSGLPQAISWTLKTDQIKFGTKSLDKAVNQARQAAGDQGPYEDSVKSTIQSSVAPRVEELARTMPGIRGLPRAYLSGGIVWAAALLRKPQEVVVEKKPYVYLSYEDIVLFCNQAQKPSSGDDIYRYNSIGVTDDDAVKAEVARLRKVFDQNAMASGSALLKAIATEFQLANKDQRPKKAIVYCNNALYAWPLGYLKKALPDAAWDGLVLSPDDKSSE